MLQSLVKFFTPASATYHDSIDTTGMSNPTSWSQDSLPELTVKPPNAPTAVPIPIQPSSVASRMSCPTGPTLTKQMVHHDPALRWWDDGGCSPNTGYLSGLASSFGTVSPMTDSCMDLFDQSFAPSDGPFATLSEEFLFGDVALSSDMDQLSSQSLSPSYGHLGLEQTASESMHQRQSSYASSTMFQETASSSYLSQATFESQSMPDQFHMMPGDAMLPSGLVPPSPESPYDSVASFLALTPSGVNQNMTPLTQSDMFHCMSFGCPPVESVEMHTSQPNSLLNSPSQHCFVYNMVDIPQEPPNEPVELQPVHPQEPPSGRQPTGTQRVRHTCPYCSHTSDRANNMKEHIYTHLPNRPKPFKCPTCSKPFARKHDMRRHIKTHERRFHYHTVPYNQTGPSVNIQGKDEPNIKVLPHSLPL